MHAQFRTIQVQYIVYTIYKHFSSHSRQPSESVTFEEQHSFLFFLEPPSHSWRYFYSDLSWTSHISNCFFGGGELENSTSSLVLNLRHCITQLNTNSFPYTNKSFLVFSTGFTLVFPILQRTVAEMFTQSCPVPMVRISLFHSQNSYPHRVLVYSSVCGKWDVRILFIRYSRICWFEWCPLVSARSKFPLHQFGNACDLIN